MVGQKPDSFWKFITLQQLGVGRRMVCQTFPIFVRKNYKTRMSVKLKILCVVCIDIQCIWNYAKFDWQQRMNFTQFFTQTNSESNSNRVTVHRAVTRSSAIAAGPHDASCQLKSCQLPCNSAETTCTTSPEQIEVMKLEGYSGAIWNKHVHSTILLENFATASRRYTGDVHNSSVVGLFMTPTGQWKRLDCVVVECTCLPIPRR